MAGKLSAGAVAPDFELRDQFGNTVRLSDFRGSRVLLYFYPRASTSGCTTQAQAVRDGLPELREHNVVAVGVSPDPPPKQKKFDDKNELGFPLLADEDHAVAEAFGVWGEKKMYGKTSMGIVRSSFVIDEEGRVVEPFYKVSPKDTMPKAKKALGL